MNATKVDKKEVARVVEHIRRDCPYWAPEQRIGKLVDLVGVYSVPMADAIVEVLQALPENERVGCGVSLLRKIAT
jgi:hypothetical protein